MAHNQSPASYVKFSFSFWKTIQFSLNVAFSCAIFHYIGLKCDMFGLVYTHTHTHTQAGWVEGKAGIARVRHVFVYELGSFVWGSRAAGVGLNFRFVSISPFFFYNTQLLFFFFWVGWRP